MKCAFEVAQKGNKSIVDYSIFEGDKRSHIFFTLISLDKNNLYDVLSDIEVWFCDFDTITMVSSIVPSEDDSESLDSILKYQFGRNEHYFVETSGVGMWKQYKFCYSDGVPKQIEDEGYFIKTDDGRVQVECLIDLSNCSTGEFYGDRTTDYTEIFFYDNQYVEYGCKEVNPIEEFDNYDELITIVEEAVFNNNYIAQHFEATPISVDKISLVNVLKTPNDYYFFNYQVHGMISEEEVNAWEYAVLSKIGAENLQVEKVVFGKKEDRSMAGYPLYYGVNEE